ncbi:MAG: metallophosphoesterase [Candidatus Helarchaeota archaeon]
MIRLEKIKFIKDYPALTIRDNENQILIISDLHLGIEHAKEGVNIPSQTNVIIDELSTLIKNFQVSKIILLGDIKHNIPQISPKEWLNIPNFFKKLMSKAPISIIKGNHDGDLDALISSKIEIHKNLVLSIDHFKIGLMHGHTMIPLSFFETDTIIMGHNHPSIKFEDELGVKSYKPVWIRTKWDRKKIAITYLNYRKITPKKNPIIQFEKKFNIKIKNPDIIIMPAFNNLIKGHEINKKPLMLLGPIFQSKAINLNESEIIMLDGTYLGKLGELTVGK